MSILTLGGMAKGLAVWGVSQYAASYVHYWYCTPPTLTGFLLSPLYAISPQCQGLSWFINSSSSTLSVIIPGIGMFIVNKLGELVAYQ